MKKAFSVIVFLVCFCLVSFAWADPPMPNKSISAPTSDEGVKEQLLMKGMCPTTKVVGDAYSCFYCHAYGRDFLTKIEETAPDAHLDYPIKNFRIENGVGYFLFNDIDPDAIFDITRYLDLHNVKKLVLESYSPGGAMMAAWRCVGLLNTWKAKGNIVETRCQGYAASAAFLVFASGSNGYRFVSPTAELMWHELKSFKFFDMSSPADKEDEAGVLRHLQDNANQYLSSVSNMTKDEIDERVRKKEFWMTGREAVEFGFADGLLGE